MRNTSYRSIKDLIFCYLRDGNSMDLSVAIEGCNKLSLAPSCQHSNDFFLTSFLLLDRLVKDLCFRLCQSCIDLLSNIPI